MRQSRRRTPKRELANLDQESLDLSSPRACRSSAARLAAESGAAGLGGRPRPGEAGGAAMPAQAPDSTPAQSKSRRGSSPVRLRQSVLSLSAARLGVQRDASEAGPDDARLSAGGDPPAVPEATREAAPEASEAPRSAGSAPRKRQRDGCEMEGLLAAAAEARTVGDLTGRVLALFPASRGSARKAATFKEMHATLCPGQSFTSRATALPAMVRSLWTLAGKDGAEGEASVHAGQELASDQHLETAGPKSKVDEPLSAASGHAHGAAEGSEAGVTVVAEQPLRGPAGIVQPELKEEAKSGLEAALLVPDSLAHHPEGLVRLAWEVRDALGLGRGQAAHLRTLMRTGLLAGRSVRFQTKNGRVLLTGRVDGAGQVVCGCRACAGAACVSPSEFEEHSGSRDRRPADGIFLDDFDVSIKTLLGIVNSAELAAAAADLHADACHACALGGDLLCCDACTSAWHLACAELDAVPPGDWLCRLCVADGGTGGRGGGVRPTAPDHVPGRVRMAAPSRDFRVAGARGVRNQNKHRRLFEGGEGALRQGDALSYQTAQGEVLLRGTAVVSAMGPSGILCDCCGAVVSCSQFEAHAGRAQRRQPYENIYTADGIPLKQLALLLPDLEEGGEDAGAEDDAGEGHIVMAEDGATGGCVLCHEPDFQRGGFGPRTIMICDQCEREFHVGCLADAGLAHLDALPEGEWFCSGECSAIHARLRARVEEGVVDIPGHPQHSWQVLRGKDGRVASAWALRAAQEVLQESFDPIVDMVTGADLLPLMLHARSHREWDYKGMHTLLLRHKGKPVVSAIVRVLGPGAAELPLIATRFAARRQGHARVLVDAFCAFLADAGVHRLVLPAAHETVLTWQHGFGMAHMPEEALRLYRHQLHILVFPGTEVLWKTLPGTAAPAAHHTLHARPDPAVHTVAAVLAGIVAAVEGEHVAREVAAVVAELVQAAVEGVGGEDQPGPREAVRGGVGSAKDPTRALLGLEDEGRVPLTVATGTPLAPAAGPRPACETVPAPTAPVPASPAELAEERERQRVHSATPLTGATTPAAGGGAMLPLGDVLPGFAACSTPINVA
ncbi:Nucleosome-remodeling factor subunit BPTF [Auxenochlorella protothecoides]|uniref:Nucleosome-remodeling factor subunit BPTF n=1 Tax=Auxenochlorella protothecoides TaxID=3075 RepID=A0A087SJ97_AUXPR|nr:Nucleosome-remodeling factor subunit BPTF [Auxenochlorella protothecoides]KFM25801.1 Nucleosome-remodeling factor subunit BPTF [Auxenochlorella protothecoides]